ncbi:hypothetical protein EBE87_20305 [Pseudoroseomonas wenyumeiae]|uniref:Uncharacterized protein n=1 Tax=Teichococcus wenyumeiae TaxID=2478470 RepID=A0A3A9JLY6_9PROT|nr:hypothetical protein [Pseudoroseomonas wenyumeiae]RKK04826.1 hypothetical protein D6Z83_07580 [Pseudoroseomonas wenyumeiae]RMI19494.1 hypothetical protein EBE87_20305 [Pseudoroseomonas wenyumeiae]
MVRIATLAGNGAFDARSYMEGRLYVEGVTQAALNAALAEVGDGASSRQPVPESVTPLQARKALRAAGLLPQVQTAIAAAGDEAQEEWDYALEVRRDHPLLNAVAGELGLERHDIDALFRSAALL